MDTTGGVNINAYVRVILLVLVCPVCVCLFVCDLKSKYCQKFCHSCQTFTKFGTFLHKTQQRAPGTKEPKINRFSSIISLSKVT